MDEIKLKVIKWLEPKLDELDCFLVEVKINTANNKYEVYVDSMENIEISTCEKISRSLEFHLDNDEAIPENYNLEVSSPARRMPHH